MTTVVIAGATGFVGRAVAAALCAEHEVIGLSRAVPADRGACSSWRACDLFSLRDAEEAVSGADYAIYLVHSMMPSARLVQGSFGDLDLVCADNFARACAAAGVRQIVYLGGLIPGDGAALSPHLQSRLEVEKTLGAHGVPVTALRAGLVVGAGGSSLRILLRLVQRLPLLVCPKWTEIESQPIALGDVVTLVGHVLGRAECLGETYDLGGPDVLTYRAMLEQTAELLGVRRVFVRVPLFSPGLSRLWVSLVTGASSELVGPLVESLRHRMVARDRRLQEAAGLDGTPFREAMRQAIERERAPVADRPVLHRAPYALRRERRVRSVQRMVLPPRRDATFCAEEYLRWLPGALWLLLRVTVSPERVCRFSLFGVPLLELTFSTERSSPDRQLLYLTGGVLVRPNPRGRLEFREVLERRYLVTAIHDFTPRLPFFVYQRTQALAHLWVMWRFGRHLRRMR